MLTKRLGECGVVWCDRKQVDPLEAPVNLVVEFLSELYQKGLEYRTINVYHSAISAYHKPINGMLSGIDNLRPPTVRCLINVPPAC